MTAVYDAPIAEVSGACFAGEQLVIVGDSEPVVAWAQWTVDGPGPWQTLNVGDLPGAPDDTGQFEAVEHLRDDVVVILCEEPALLVAVDLGSREIVGSWHMRVELKGLRKAWRKDDNSHGEGLFFGDDRVFLIKEKEPAAVVEFGPAGADSLGDYRPGTWAPTASGELEALAWWPLEDAEDISDACVVDGTVWVISDQDRTIGPLGGKAQKLPSQIDKPEGLAMTPQGRWLVAVDNEDGRAALHILD